MDKTIKIILLMLVMISVVGATPPISSISLGDSGLELEVAAPIHIPTNTFINVTFHIFNKSNGVLMNPSDYSCTGHLMNPYGIEIAEETAGVYEHSVYFTLNETMAQESGIYPYTFHCNNSVQGGFYTSYFEVSETGTAIEPEFSTLIASILLIFFGAGIFFILFAKNTEHAGVKLFLNMIAYFMMFLAIGGSYITLQGLQTDILPIGLGVIYVFGIVLVIIMYYIFINLTRQALALMRAKRGFGGELDDPTIF